MGEVPPFVTVAVNVTGVPGSHISFEAVITMVGSVPLVVAIAMELLVPVLIGEQVELVVTTQVITLPKFTTAT